MGPAFSMTIYGEAVRRAAEVAAASMSLELALGGQPKEPYAVSFDKIYHEEIIRSLARTHAAQGEAGDALAWARRIGDERVAADDGEAAGRAHRLIYALVGVAEGLLERSSAPERK